MSRMSLIRPTCAVVALLIALSWGETGAALATPTSLVPRCRAVLVNRQPDGSYGAGATDIHAVRLSCRRARALVRAWFRRNGRAPRNWDVFAAGSRKNDYTPTHVLQRGSRFVVVGGCAGAGCPGRVPVTSRLCGVNLYVRGISCGRARRVGFNGDRRTFPGWRCGAVRSSWNSFCARGRALALFDVGE